MAVTTTEIRGTDSISGSRITINDNFSTLKEALNSVLSAYDIGTGRFDNTTAASLNDIKTTKIQITGAGGLTLDTGGITVSSGSIKITAGSLNFANASLQQQTIGSSPVVTVTGASAFKFPVGSTFTATGGTGMAVYVPGSGLYIHEGGVWTKL